MNTRMFKRFITRVRKNYAPLLGIVETVKCNDEDREITQWLFKLLAFCIILTFLLSLI